MAMYCQGDFSIVLPGGTYRKNTRAGLFQALIRKQDAPAVTVASFH